MSLKLLSINLAGYRNWGSRVKNIINLINSVSPDLVLLQEVIYDSRISAYSQSIYINQLLNEPFKNSMTDVSRFYVPSVGEPYREGLAILSKYPLENGEVLSLRKEIDDEHTRIVQNVDVKYGDSIVQLSNVHFSNNKYSADQLSELLAILASRGEERIIVGDFNIFDIERLKSTYEEKYAVSTEFTKYVSYLPEHKTIDYMLLPREYSFAHIKTYENVSDHAAILYTIHVT